MRNTRLTFILAACLVAMAVVPAASAQVDPDNRANTTVVDRDDGGFDEWGLLGLLGLAGLMGRKRRDEVHVAVHPERNAAPR